MPRGKGNPRCRFCQGRGVIRGPNGMTKCECVRVTPRAALLAELRATPLVSFADWYDADRAARGLPPFEDKPQVRNDEDTDTQT